VRTLGADIIIQRTEACTLSNARKYKSEPNKLCTLTSYALLQNNPEILIQQARQLNYNCALRTYIHAYIHTSYQRQLRDLGNSAGSCVIRLDGIKRRTTQRAYVQDSSVPDPNTERAKHTQAMLALVREKENDVKTWGGFATNFDASSQHVLLQPTHCYTISATI